MELLYRYEGYLRAGVLAILEGQSPKSDDAMNAFERAHVWRTETPRELKKEEQDEIKALALENGEKVKALREEIKSARRDGDGSSMRQYKKEHKKASSTFYSRLVILRR